MDIFHELTSHLRYRLREIAGHGALQNMDGDPARPACHFLPPSGWMNDPNGLIHYCGEYHLFYQYNPDNPFGPATNAVRWGHAVSADLVRWRHLPSAMLPDRSWDGGGVWTGCAVDDGECVRAFYTGVSKGIFQRQSQCMATSGGGLTEWEKSAKNPVIEHPPRGVSPWFFRDPYVFRHESEWLMVVGASLRGKGAALLYRSDDLESWEYLGPLYMSGRKKHGVMWECPGFFCIGDVWYLLVSLLDGRVIYFAGSFENMEFAAESCGRIETGGCFLAPQVFSDASGRLLMFGWLRETERSAWRRGWQGVMSLPRALERGGGGELLVRPAAEVNSLRGGSIATLDDISFRKGNAQIHCPHLQFEMRASFDPLIEDTLSIAIIFPGDSRRKIKIRYSGGRKRISIEYRDPRCPEAGRRIVITEDCVCPAGEPGLKVYVDHSVVEVFTNSGKSCSLRIYPDEGGGCDVKLTGHPTEPALRKFDIFELERLGD